MLALLDAHRCRGCQVLGLALQRANRALYAAPLMNGRRLSGMLSCYLKNRDLGACCREAFASCDVRCWC